MTGKDLRTKFERMSIHAQAWFIVLTAMIGANALTAFFYGLFFRERLALDLVFTSVIVVLIGTPIAYYFMHQQALLRTMAERLSRMARIDGLTNLANRATFFDRANLLIERGGKGKSAGALLFIDADRFKSINDTFGHAVGDNVLKVMANAIRECIREEDLAGRLGGEEFAVLLVGANRTEALRVSERIRRAVHKVSREIGVADRVFTVSIGVALHRPGQSLDDALIIADRHLYAAKEQGRDCVVDKMPDQIAA